MDGLPHLLPHRARRIVASQRLAKVAPTLRKRPIGARLFYRRQNDPNSRLTLPLPLARSLSRTPRKSGGPARAPMNPGNQHLPSGTRTSLDHSAIAMLRTAWATRVRCRAMRSSGRSWGRSCVGLEFHAVGEFLCKQVRRFAGARPKNDCFSSLLR
jgi:hypothetical protein